MSLKEETTKQKRNRIKYLLQSLNNTIRMILLIIDSDDICCHGSENCAILQTERNLKQLFHNIYIFIVYEIVVLVAVHFLTKTL